jgi:hypothetical protein
MYYKSCQTWIQQYEGHKQDQYSVCYPAAFSRQEDVSQPEKDHVMGDKGGKKDKAKNKKQKVKKQEYKVKTKQDKQLASPPTGSS